MDEDNVDIFLLWPVFLLSPRWRAGGGDVGVCVVGGGVLSCRCHHQKVRWLETNFKIIFFYWTPSDSSWGWGKNEFPNLIIINGLINLIFRSIHINIYKKSLQPKNFSQFSWILDWNQLTSVLSTISQMFWFLTCHVAISLPFILVNQFKLMKLLIKTFLSKNVQRVNPSKLKRKVLNSLCWIPRLQTYWQADINRYKQKVSFYNSDKLCFRHSLLSENILITVWLPASRS